MTQIRSSAWSPPAGSSRPSTCSPANARSVISNGAPGSPASANSPFLVPTSNSVIARSSSRKRGQDVDAVVRRHSCLLRARLAVDEHVDVAAQDAALVEYPALHRGVLALEREQQVAYAAAVDAVLGAAR